MTTETCDGAVNYEDPASALPIKNQDQDVLVANEDGDIIADSPYSDRRSSLAENALVGVAFLGNAFVLLTILFSPEIVLFTVLHLLVKH